MITPHPQEGSFRLFKFRDIQVSVHWSWLLVAWFQIQRTQASREYLNPVWAVYEYLALFGIVLLHEFGHSLATRQVGGRSDNIILWPFGGIAFIQAPPRPGAHLWSIAAGPLVNVALIPVFWILKWLVVHYTDNYELMLLLRNISFINWVLLIFNLLPIYPLDGGQILQALLWYKLGYARALLIASVVGMAGALGLAIWLLTSSSSILFALMLLFLLINAWSSFQRARQLLAQGPPWSN